MERERVRMLQPADAAWIAGLPCALVLVAAIVWLGPPLGHALPGPGSDTLWPREAPYVFGHPEPVKHARYLIALAGPLLLAGAVLASARRRVELRPRPARTLVFASQAALVALLVAAVLGQHHVLRVGADPIWPILSYGKIVVAAALVLLFLVAIRRAPVARLAVRATREVGWLRIACLAVAVVLAGCWLFTAVQTDRSLGDPGALNWTMDDAFAVLDGRTPLVDYHALYAQLVPYLSAATLGLFGGTTLVFTLTMEALSLLTLLAVYATFRRIVRSSPLALALYLPMVAAGFLLGGSGAGQASNVAYYSMWPMRYGGAYLMAWLTVRHLDGAAPRRAWPLGFVGGLVLVDNLEFGLPAFAATVAALLAVRRDWSWRAVARLAAELAIGVLAAVALFAAATAVRAGRLPRPGILLEFPRIFGTAGATAIPMATFGLHLALYVTFVAALVMAIVRRIGCDDTSPLTGALAWSGVFGLLAGSYFMGRSDYFKLIGLFSAWFFALGLIAVVVIRDLAARGWRRPGIPELAVLLGFGVAICSFNELPMPWKHLAHLRHDRPQLVLQPLAQRFVAEHAGHDRAVAILIGLGHRMAYRLGIENVSPYSFMETMVVRSQLRNVVDEMRRERAHLLFLPNAFAQPAQLRLLRRAGFTPRLENRLYALWSDA
jgi:hypothetical protein